MGLFSRRDPDASLAEARIARLEAHLGSLQTYLEEVARTEQGTPAPDGARLAAPGAEATPDPDMGDGPPRIVNADMVESALEDLRTRLEELASGLHMMEARLTSMGAELTHQLSELGNEIDALADGSPTGDGALAELKASQVRLAQEQARYQIAFKSDLAELAERLMRRN